MTKPTSYLRMSNPWHLLAIGFGSGLSPVVPGTMGTLASIPFYLLLMHLPLLWYVIVLIMASVIGVTICQRTSHDMKVHDHGSIVWDEFVGFWITMLVVPVLHLDPWNWKIIVAGFVLFRLFDMVKPWPISWFDKNVAGGFGIMIDDIVAGGIAALVLWGITVYFGF